jgi:hypothetical protein
MTFVSERPVFEVNERRKNVFSDFSPQPAHARFGRGAPLPLGGA